MAQIYYEQAQIGHIKLKQAVKGSNIQYRAQIGYMWFKYAIIKLKQAIYGLIQAIQGSYRL